MVALKTKTVTITADNRDKGKTFLLTEMPAVAVESWARRMLRGLSKAGVELPDDAMDMGIATVFALGARSIVLIDDADAEPLMAEMLACAQIVPDATKSEVRRPIIASDIEEVSTLLTLRSEIIELHVGFSIAAALSAMGAAAKANGSRTPTSPSSSEASSEPASLPSTN